MNVLDEWLFKTEFGLQAGTGRHQPRKAASTEEAAFLHAVKRCRGANFDPEPVVAVGRGPVEPVGRLALQRPA